MTADEAIELAQEYLGQAARASKANHPGISWLASIGHGYATLALAIVANNDSEYKRRRIDDVANAWLFGTGEPQELKGLSGLLGDDEGEGPEMTEMER